jgi:hypothetical protein
MGTLSNIRHNINTFLSKPLAEIGGLEITRRDATYLVGALAAAVTLSLNPDVRQAVIDSNIPVGTPFVEIDRQQEHNQTPQDHGLEMTGVYNGVQVSSPDVIYSSPVDVATVPIQLQASDFLPR